MSDSWTPKQPEAEPALPRVEDLPVAPEGYERAAVEAAFEAFYRHSAQLDATLRVLESVDAFQRQAGELRADIRALRAASWGPMAVARPSWSPGYAGREERFEFAGAAVTRLAVEAALIVAVAVGTFAAGLGVVWTVVLVAAAWVVVGAIEVAASIGRPRLSAPAPPPPRRVEPAAVPAPEPEPAPAEPLVAEQPSLVLRPGGFELPAQPKRRFWQRARREEGEEAVAEPPRNVRIVADPWELGPAEPEAAPEPQSPLVAAQPAIEESPEPAAPKRRFRRRQPEERAQPVELPEHDHVRVVEVDRSAEDTDERPPFPSLTPKPPPRERLRRGRR